jgi:hypothetical protein
MGNLTNRTVAQFVILAQNGSFVMLHDYMVSQKREQLYKLTRQKMS